jgi:hypothetical protein
MNRSLPLDTAQESLGSIEFLLESRLLEANRPSKTESPGSPASGGWESTIDELLRFRNLPNDWDGEGTDAPSDELVDAALCWAKDFQAGGITPPDRVHVSVNATIYFEWHNRTFYYEMEVHTPEEIEGRLLRHDLQTKELHRFRRPSGIADKISPAPGSNGKQA